MRVLVDSGNCVTQNRSGGIQTKVFEFIKHMPDDCETKLFDKWRDSIEDYDILHVFMASYDEYSIVKLAKSRGIPVVVSAVVPSKHQFRIRFSLLINRFIPLRDTYWMTAKLLQSADCVIAETVYEKAFISKYYGIDSTKIAVIPNGVDIPNDDSNINSDYFESKTGIKEKFILQVGRFDNNKNQINVIRAVNGTDMQLVLIGGPDKSEPEYYSKCQSIAGSNVHFLGWIDHNDPLLQAAFQKAQVVVLPSYREIFGNAMFEGGINGANIVVTNVLPIQEWGFDSFVETINPFSVEDIKQKLRIAYQKEKSSLLSDLIISNFSWETVITQHINLYRELLNDYSTNKKYSREIGKNS